jgi:hypothetical protein
VSRILTLLEGIPFGKSYFEITVILRNSFLVNSMLTHSEAWYNVSKAELDYQERVDKLLLRRNLIKKRRILFLYYLPHQDPGSMLYEFLETKLRNRNTTVLKDLEELKWEINIDELKNMKNQDL